MNISDLKPKRVKSCKTSWEFTIPDWAMSVLESRLSNRRRIAWYKWVPGQGWRVKVWRVHG